jgi:hypothetical protein
MVPPRSCQSRDRPTTLDHVHVAFDPAVAFGTMMIATFFFTVGLVPNLQANNIAPIVQRRVDCLARFEVLERVAVRLPVVRHGSPSQAPFGWRLGLGGRAAWLPFLGSDRE